MNSKIRIGHIPKIKMNKTEAAFFSLLNIQKKSGEIIDFGYEKIKLRLGNNCWYTPDFHVRTKDNELVIIETKGGFIRDDSIVKFKAACELYPYIHFQMWQYKKNTWSKIREN